MGSQMGTWQKFTRAFQLGSSDLDWCERNYVVTPLVAEFYNTVTNILFIAIPPFLMYLFRHYSRNINWSCHLVYMLVITVGVGSAYFHGTLSLAGQLIDELAILWVGCAAIASWTPKSILPTALAKHPHRYQIVVLILTVVGTWAGCLYPVINAFALMTISIPAGIVILREAKRSPDKKTRRLGVRCIYCWIIAVVIWLSDQFMCPFWLSINFPYLHSLWHVISFFACNEAIVFIAYIDTTKGYSKLQPGLKYWPVDNGYVGLPYISFNSPLPLTKKGKSR